MQTVKINVDPDHALDLYRAYKKHQHYGTAMDWECQRIYQLIAAGKLVIKALESVALAGVDAKGLPKLALARADVEDCEVSVGTSGSATMWSGRGYPRSWRRRFDWPNGSFARPEGHRHSSARGILPLIPVHLRPRRGLENYHVLWEAEWQPIAPRDPYLLRRIGKADAWLVCAAWDLTEVERAVLGARIRA